MVCHFELSLVLVESRSSQELQILNLYKHKKTNGRHILPSSLEQIGWEPWTVGPIDALSHSYLLWKKNHAFEYRRHIKTAYDPFKLCCYSHKR